MRGRELRTFAFVAVLAGCGAPAATGHDPAAPVAATAPKGEPLTAEAARAKWSSLVAEETEVVHAIDEMAGLPPDARMKRLSRARDGAGFLSGGLGAMNVPSELGACHTMALEGARALKSALDGINDVWMGRVQADRAASAKLAEAICLGAGRMAAGRTSCAVPGSVPAPLACTP